jgi:hypothetical protein
MTNETKNQDLEYVALVDHEGTAWGVGKGITKSDACDAALEDYENETDLSDPCSAQFEDLNYQEINATEYEIIKRKGGIGWQTEAAKSR